MTKVAKLIPILAMASLVGCSNMTSTEQSVLSGAAIGAVGGAAIGAISGGSGAAGTGALIGAGVGAVGGYIYDRSRNDDY
jgi:membrane associated rhomboid family serine protease